jgi:hypothetical protein
MVLVKTDVKEMYSKSQMVVFIIMELLINVLLVYIILILKNGLIIKILFVGMVDYLNINIIFLPVDILINVIYYHIKLIKDGLLVLQ